MSGGKKLDVDGLCGRIELRVPAKAYFLYSVASHSSKNFIESLEKFMLNYAEKEFRDNPELGERLWQHYLEQADIYEKLCRREHEQDVENGSVPKRNIPMLIPVDENTKDGEHWFMEPSFPDIPEPTLKGHEFDVKDSEPDFPSNG